MVSSKKTRRTRRKLTTETAHDMHRNPYNDASNIYMAMQWAHEHHALCLKCRRRIERMSTPDYEQKQIAKRLARTTEGDE